MRLEFEMRASLKLASRSAGGVRDGVLLTPSALSVRITGVGNANQFPATVVSSVADGHHFHLNDCK
jgi:hypothetical protein